MSVNINVNVERIKEDINNLKTMDINQEIEKRVEELRVKIIADRDAKIQKLESLLEMLERYKEVEPEKSGATIDSESDISDDDVEDEGQTENDTNADVDENDDGEEQDEIDEDEAITDDDYEDVETDDEVDSTPKE